ncbi:MAG: hypothetical protein JKY67_14425 [Pseudomonadales bacterium]|nr:hypothetical protein [Pseudomonadales bacterium]
MVFSSGPVNTTELAQFSNEYQLEWLSQPTVECLIKKEFSLDKVDGLHEFVTRLDQELLNHPVIGFNEYCNWFRQGEMSPSVVKEFIVQFSVFSNLSLTAQLQKMLNAETIATVRASTEILAYEVGAIIVGDSNGDSNGDAEGEEKGTHYEWLLKMGESLGLSFTDMGKRHHGSVSTLFFCDELARLYGDSNCLTATAASYAIDSWAAAGYWDHLIEGLVKFREKNDVRGLPLVSFTSHSEFERNHAKQARQELEGFYFTHEVNEDAFIIRANEMLDGVEAFWDGLDQHRKALH